MRTERKVFYKKLLALVFPIAVQNLMTALVSASDALMLGFLNQTALSAVSLATQVQFVLNLFFTALTIGATVLAAQHFSFRGYATTIARAAELLLTIFENIRTGVVRVRLKYFHSVLLKRDYYRYTMPVLANKLVWGCGFTMFSVITGHLGSDAVAANAVANIAKNMIACVCLGIATGSGILVGNELGSGNLETARKYGRLLCKISLITGSVSGLFILLSSPVIMMFTTMLSCKLDAPAPCRLDAPDFDVARWGSADCLHQHQQVI